MDRCTLIHRSRPPLVCWGNAWLAGHVGLDEAADRVERQAGPHSSPEAPATSPSADSSPTCGRGLKSLRLPCPSPGDPLGLSGPPPSTPRPSRPGRPPSPCFPTGASGWCPWRPPRVIVRGGSLAVHGGRHPYARTCPRVAEAERELTARCGRRPTRCSAWTGPRRSPRRLETSAASLAPGYPARAHRVAALAARLDAVLRVADERGLTSGQIAARGQALRELDRAVRRARVAAHHAIFELVSGVPPIPGRVVPRTGAAPGRRKPGRLSAERRT